MQEVTSSIGNHQAPEIHQIYIKHKRRIYTFIFECPICKKQLNCSRQQISRHINACKRIEENRNTIISFILSRSFFKSNRE